MKTFSESERMCQMAFDSCGNVWHGYTSGKEMPMLFVNDEDLIFAMNVIAYAAFVYKGVVRILTFEVMNNHFHFVLCGNENDIQEFFRFIVRKLKRTIPCAGNLKLELKPVADLQSLRNNIVYNNRNGYVADPGHTPFSYPWGAGRYYFNSFPITSTFKEISYLENRRMFRGANVDIPDDWQVIDGYIAPPSFCDIRLGMAMFRDAHHYFAMVTKNVEAYSGIAVELDDGEFLTDQELYSQLLQKVRDQYRVASFRDLSKAQRLDLARTLHYDYRSSNGQIRRVLGLTQYEVDSLFPMGK